MNLKIGIPVIVNFILVHYCYLQEKKEYLEFECSIYFALNFMYVFLIKSVFWLIQIFVETYFTEF